MNNKYQNIEERVTCYVEGKHGRIGIIVPDEKLTIEEWKKFNEEIADIIYNYGSR